MPERDLNPSRRHGSERPGSVSPTRPPSHSIRSALFHLRASDCPSPDSTGVGAFAFRPECPVPLKGIGPRWRAGGHHALRRFASQSKVGVHLRPSNGSRFVMRLHTVSKRVAWPEAGLSSHRLPVRSDRVGATRLRERWRRLYSYPSQCRRCSVAAQRMWNGRPTRSRRGARRPAWRRCPW